MNNKIKSSIITISIILSLFGGFAGSAHAQTTTIPVPNASIYASLEGGYWPAYGGTNGQGVYNITGGYYDGRGYYLPTGNYTISASANGYVRTAIEKVNVKDGLETTNANILLPVSGAISGKITDAISGLPLQEVFVNAALNPLGKYGAFGTTDQNGNYMISTDLPTGTYNITVDNAVGYLSKTITGASITVGAMTSNVNIALSRSATITGTVKDAVSLAALEGIQVVAQTSGESDVTQDFTNSTGKYALNTDLKTGTYDIRVVSPEGYIEKNITGIAVTEGSQRTIDLLLDRSGIISGRITSATSGQPLDDASVWASSSSYNGIAYTNSTGYYRITDGLGTGSYRIVVWYQNSYIEATGVNVVQGAETPNVNLQIAITELPHGTITGRVTNSTGGPVYAQLQATGDSDYGTASTDANGNYALTVGATGTYNVTVTSTGFADKNQTSLSVTLNQVTSNINFQLQLLPSGRISGTVQALAAPIPEFHNELIMLLVFASTTAAIVARKKNIKIQF